MTKLKQWATNRWFWRFLGAILGGLLIWFVGPLVSIADHRPLGWWVPRLIVALLPLILVGLFCWLAQRRAARANAALVDALAPAPGAAERSELESKLTDALAMLRSTKLGKRGAYVYQLPWYAIIGPSGAGKTTALLNCGLNFPTAVAGEYRALRGQPQTPNCDWWFTDEAVLIDTAGRYVTQDDGARDAEGWTGFLNLLNEHRPLQPLNGVLVAVPAPDLADPAKMASHAEHIRARLREIMTRLNQDLPVYVLITKADLLPGFREYFARDTDAESAQVFGSTAAQGGHDEGSILSGFDALVTGIAGRTVERMQNEPELPRRAEIAAFPAQLASLRKPIATLLGELSHKSRFERPARIRGIYLTSGTQTGNPVDRILLNVGMPALASSHGVGSGRSYFLSRLFSDVLFPEEGLATVNPAARTRQQWVYRGGIAASVCLLCVAVLLWGLGYGKNERLIASIYDTAQAYQATGATADGSGAPEVELAALDVLAKARTDLAEAPDFGLGLGQGPRLSREVSAIYGRDLQRRLSPMLAGLAADRMQTDTNQPAALYDDLKSYLILGGRGPFDGGKALIAWVQPAWIARGGQADQAGDIARHAAALADYPFRATAVDDGAIETARGIIRSQPAAVRVYGRIKSQAIAGGSPAWTARDHAGPSPETFFASDGAFAPGAGVPALFTRSGYEKQFLPALANGPGLMNEERWVVGDTTQPANLDLAGMAVLKTDLQRLYFDDFLTLWRNYMAAMKPRPATSLTDNIQRLRDASGPLSPIPPLMHAIATATDMTQGGGATSAAASRIQVSSLPGGSLVSGQLGQAAIAGAGASMAGNGDDPRANATRAFEPLRQYVGKAGSPGPMDQMLASMGQLADKLNTVSALAGSGGPAGAQASQAAREAINALQQGSSSAQGPAGAWAASMANDASVSLGGARLSQVNSTIGQNFGPACREGLSQAFPMQPATTKDVALADFARFFAPQGAFANLASQDLAGYIDTSKPQWTALPNAAEVGLTQQGVASLQAAQTVTRAFFANDPNSPRLTYQIEPVALSGATSVTLVIDGQTLKYDGKTPLPATFDWPGSGGAILSFTTATTATTDKGATSPPTPTPPAPLKWQGPWAAFRAMKAANVRSTGSPDTGTGQLSQGGSHFSFRVRSFGGANPLVADLFSKVSCPV